MGQWLDQPFIDLVSQILDMLPYFMKQARYLAGLVLLFNVSFMIIKYAITKQGLKEDIVKTATAMVLFTILINLYPTIMKGINSIVYQFAVNSTYTNALAKTIDATRYDSEFWQKKGNPEDTMYSTIIKKVQYTDGDGQVGEKYILDLFLEDTGYMSPSAVMRIIMLIIDNMWTFTNKLKFLFNPMEFIMTLLCILAVLIAGLFGAGQYFVAAGEFALITSVGIITLPGMLWNSTKFITEKFLGAVFGFFIKMLFVSITIMLMFNGMLNLMTREFSGAIDEIIYTLFSCVIYTMLCQSAPQLAVSLLTGTPQMSLMEAMAAAGTLAGVGMMSAKGIATGGLSLAGGTAKTIGSAIQGGQNAATSVANSGGGTIKQVAAAVGGGIATGGASALHSVVKTAGSTLNTIGKNLTGRQSENPHSSMNSFKTGRDSSYHSQSPDFQNNSNSPANARSNTQYVQNKFNEGKDFGNKFFKSDTQFSQNLPPHFSNNQNPFGLLPPSENYPSLPDRPAYKGLPSSQENPPLPPSQERFALPPPSSTPSTLALPAPQ